MKKYERPELETLEFESTDVLKDSWDNEDVDGEGGWI